MTKNEDLKALLCCPFCGGEATGGMTKLGILFWCTKCGCEQRSKLAWQTRPSVTPTDTAMEDAAQREPAEVKSSETCGESNCATSSTTDGDAEWALALLDCLRESIVYADLSRSAEKSFALEKINTIKSILKDIKK